jgi:hypothetical protein
VNGDGFADVIVGDAEYDNGQTNEGAAFLFHGSASGIASGTPASANGRIEGNRENGAFFPSLSVASAGDVNGDGFGDVILGLPWYPSVPNDFTDGGAFVFLGNAAGRPVRAQQRRGDGSGVPVQSWGRAHSATSFAAELRGSHPGGTGRVRGEFEACPAGAAFGAPSCTTGTSPNWVPVNLFAPDVLLPRTLTGLTPNKLYRWRARVQYANTTGAIPPKPAHGPWRRLGAQSVEADIRLPEPGFVLSLASGIALVAALRSRTARGGLRRW